MTVLQGRQKTVYLQHRTSTHPVMANGVCVSVFKCCTGGEERGGGRLGGVATDVEICVVTSLTPTASFSNLGCESVIHRRFCVVVVDVFVFFKVDYLCLNLAVF